MKPVAAGAVQGPEGPANEDALLLQSESSVPHPYALVNPWLFEPAVAPHIAAAESGTVIDTARIASAHARLLESADVVLAEGAGGFLVPMDEKRSIAELPTMLGMEVILVVGLRLGCLNHAFLTAEAVSRRGLTLAGWVGNEIDPAFARREANVATLTARLSAPCLGLLPWMAEPDVGVAAAALLNWLMNSARPLRTASRSGPEWSAKYMNGVDAANSCPWKNMGVPGDRSQNAVMARQRPGLDS